MQCVGESGTSIQSQGDRLERVAAANGDARHQILGTPLGHPDFVARHREGLLEEQRVFLSGIPLVDDIQSAWLLLLHCANARANYQIRLVTPEGVEAYARAHDDRIWQCLCELLKWDPAEDGREIANLPLVLGGLGLRSASRLREPAHWASWADCLVMIRQRHPDVANRLVAQLEGQPDPLVYAQRRQQRGPSLESWVSKLPHGQTSHAEPDLPSTSQRISSREHHEVAGNMKQRAGLNNVLRTISS